MSAFRNAGFSLIEVLVTILILMVGLLGLAGLQGRAVTAQMEAYQRSQALILLKDMGDRISANRHNATAYITNASGVTPAPRGTGFNGSAVQDCSGFTGSSLDLCEWHNALLGAAETQGGANVGAMIGARGCVYQVTVPASGVAGEYLVAVAWQGFNSTATPAVDCGSGQYGDEAKRRVVTLPVAIADLAP
ncbi:type IV pilus modification protein PilV [Candidatus Ferrigenium straubiae]|jgi:type IV pilus assembly protein PilV|uniref:type IV pilus modification protein PilV n=1 Tax=Candidatus Ferrigenium straubiae TaxID=2919506 RepID=UPI003F4AD113